MQKYKLLGTKGKGAFSEVYKAQDLKTDRFYAIKCMKNPFETVESVNRCREIQALRRLSPHPNIVKLHEVLYDRSNGRLALVFELLEMNVYDMTRVRRQYLPEERVIHIMYQLLVGLNHMHTSGVFHRDLKPENLLLQGDALKIADFGSCRGVHMAPPFTEYIATRWYRAPECLITDGHYGFKMDIWSVGCIFFEISALYPLFPGNDEIDQLKKIHNVLGTPSGEVFRRMTRHGATEHVRESPFEAQVGSGMARLLPHLSPEALDLMSQLVNYDPDARPTAKQALRHPYFAEIRKLDMQLRKQQQRAKEEVEKPPKRQQSNQAGGEGLSDRDDNEDTEKVVVPRRAPAGGKVGIGSHQEHLLPALEVDTTTKAKTNASSLVVAKSSVPSLPTLGKQMA